MNNAQQQPDNHWVAFLQRPTFSLVLSAVLLIAGWIAWQQLSVRRYPMIEVPRINIAVFYPNASAQLVERKITLR
ncbi:MAG: efflux RND transporter permease subunit, partial [Myxococcota bacterium]